MKIQWCVENYESSELAQFFVDNVDQDYISHGEVLDGRSIDFEHWSQNLKQKMESTIMDALSADLSGTVYSRIASAREGAKIVAIALVEFRKDSGSPCLVFHDLLVSRQSRGRGIGSEMLRWVESEAREAGIQIVILESGIRNKRAHELFERHGYSVKSIVMGKSL